MFRLFRGIARAIDRNEGAAIFSAVALVLLLAAAVVLWKKRDEVRLVAMIAARNLFATKMNIIIGFIMLLGTFFVLVGNAFIDSIDEGMTRSLQNSIAGHIQVYSSNSKEELSLFGTFGGDSNIRAITDYSKMKAAIEQHENVEKVVPMGVRGALVTSGNIIDVTLERLRKAYKARDEGKAIAQEPGETRSDINEQIASVRDHVRQMVSVLKSDQERMKAIVTEKAINKEEVEAIEKAASEQFWADFDKDPYGNLEFLENRIAPLMADGDLLWLMYTGTDFDAFEDAFDRLTIVEGQMVPKGQRGFLLTKFVLENNFKLKTARRLDLIKEGREINFKTIKDDATLQRHVKQNMTQTREIILQLDRIKTETMTKRLQDFLKTDEPELTKLLATFFETTDENFKERYDFFYAQLAPMLTLYRVKVGDVITITAFTSSGYVQSQNIPIYGIHEFKGLEKSFIAGSLNLMDLMSFRDLYGFLTPEKKAELDELKKASAAKDVRREDAEAELFGSGDSIVAEATPGVIDDAKTLGNSLGDSLHREDLIKRVYSKDEIENGMVLNAAVFLKDKDDIRKTIAAMNKSFADQKLDYKAISWQEASGFIGQLVLAAKGVLYLAILIFFTIALVVINNAMMMATLQRVREIGTMRAIGARRGFVLSMVLMETVSLGVVFGAFGALLGWGAVALMGKVGIPANSDELYFFFSGPRLHPSVSFGNIVAAFIIVLLVSAISTFYPAFIATRVQPVKAMQTDE